SASARPSSSTPARRSSPTAERSITSSTPCSTTPRSASSTSTPPTTGWGSCGRGRADASRVQRCRPLLVERREDEIPLVGAVALRVVHDRRGVVAGDRAPARVLEAGGGLRAGVLVAEAEDVAELVAQDARQRPRCDVLECADVDEELAVRAARREE